jgi:hypothetical protein
METIQISRDQAKVNVEELERFILILTETKKSAAICNFDEDSGFKSEDY